MKLGGCPPIIRVNNELKKRREFKSKVEMNKDMIRIIGKMKNIK
jgi:hypothetical protein